MRLNLTRLEEKMSDVMKDMVALDKDRPKGYKRELLALENEYNTMQQAYHRGVAFGTGYHEDMVVVTETTTNRGRKLLLLTAWVLAAILFVIWGLSVMSG